MKNNNVKNEVLKLPTWCDWLYSACWSCDFLQNRMAII